MLSIRRALVLLLLLGAGVAWADDYLLATSFFRQGKFQKALEAIDRLEKTEGVAAISPSLLFVKAQCLASLEKPKESMDALEELLRRFPNSSFTPNARAKLAQVLEDQKSYKPLIEKLTAWIQDDPAAPTWPRMLAHAYVKDGRPEEAIRWLTASKDSRNVEVLFDVLNDTSKLDAYLNDAERTSDGSYEAERRIGLLAALRKDWARARPHLEKARALVPGDTELLARSIGLAQDAKDLESAIRYARELAAAEPNNLAHVKRLGELQLAAGQHDAALGTWNQLRTRNQRDRSAHLLYANTLADHGLLDEAVTGVEGARKVFGDPALFAEELGHLHERQGDFYQATREYVQLFDAPGDKAPQLVLGMVRRHQPKPGAAAPTAGPTPTQTQSMSPPTGPPTRTSPAPGAARPTWPALDAALRAVAEATRTRPNSIEVFYLLDDLYQMAPDVEKIKALCADLVRGNTARSDAVIKAGRDFAAERRFLEARTVLGELLPHLQAPDTWEITLELAKLERQAGQVDAALNLLGQLRSTSAPESIVISARTLSAEIQLIDRKDATAARTILADLSRQYPEAAQRPHWTFLLGRCELADLAIGDASRLFAEAETSADGALMPEVQYRQAQVDLMTDRPEEARDKLQTIVVKYPASPLSQLALRDVFFLSTRKEPPSAAPTAGPTSTASPAASPPPVASPAPVASAAPVASPAPVAAPSPAPSVAASPATSAPTALPAHPTLLAEYFIQRHLLEAGRLDELDRRARPIDPAKLPPFLKADFLMLSAQALRARGQPDRAVEALEKLAKNVPEGPLLEDAILLRAEVLERDLRDRKRADDVYEEYLMLFPTSVRAEEIRRTLEGEASGTISGQNSEPAAQ